MNEKIVKQYKKSCKNDGLAVCLAIGVSALAIIAGIIGVACTEPVVLRVISAVVIVAVPTLMLLCFLKREKHAKEVRGQFEQMIKDSSMSAEEVLKLGEEMGVDLLGLAQEIRCIKELGLSGVPEWCARDGVLPTAEQVTR